MFSLGGIDLLYAADDVAEQGTGLATVNTSTDHAAVSM